MIELLAVERQPERQQPQLGQLGDHRHVVAHPAVRPAHPVGAVGDQRVEAGRHHGAEPPVGAVRALDAAQVDGLDDPVDDDVGGRLGILCGNPEFARVVVAGARRDDAERYVGLREHLQRERDDAVTADDHQRVHAALEGAVDEPSRVLGVGARDRDDVDAASVQLRDRPFGRVRRAAVPRRGVGQHRDALTLSYCSLRALRHGISLPGLRIPAGSSVALTARSTCDTEVADLVAHPRPVVGADRVVVGDGGAGAHHRVRCGGLRLAPLLDRIAALPGDDGEVQRRTGRIHMRNVAQHKRRRARFGQRRSSAPRSPRPSARARLDQLVAVSSVSHSAPADSSESRRYGALNRPCSHARAGASPSDVPPLRLQSARGSRRAGSRRAPRCPRTR